MTTAHSVEAAPAAAVADAAAATLPATHRPVDARGLALGVLATLATVFALSWAQTFLVPLLLGVVITYTLSPVVYWLERLRIPRARRDRPGHGGRRRCARPERVFAARTGADHHRATAGRNGKAVGFAGGTAEAASAATCRRSRARRPTWKAPRAAAVGGPARQPATHVIVDPPKFRLNDFLWESSLGAIGAAGQAATVAVPRVLPAARRRHVQAQARPARRSHAVEAEDHGHRSSTTSTARSRSTC